MKKPDKTYSDIGKRLRRARAFFGMSQKNFAESAGIDSGLYGGNEVGTYRISLDNSFKLAERYGLTLDFIYLGKVNTLPNNLAIALSSKSDDNQAKISSETPVA